MLLVQSWTIECSRNTQSRLFGLFVLTFGGQLGQVSLSAIFKMPRYESISASPTVNLIEDQHLAAVETQIEIIIKSICNFIFVPLPTLKVHTFELLTLNLNF